MTLSERFIEICNENPSFFFAVISMIFCVITLPIMATLIATSYFNSKRFSHWLRPPYWSFPIEELNFNMQKYSIICVAAWGFLFPYLRKKRFGKNSEKFYYSFPIAIRIFYQIFLPLSIILGAIVFGSAIWGMYLEKR